MPTTVAVCIPSIPPRARTQQLHRAISSVLEQTRQPDELHVAVDRHKHGAAATRTRALAAATTEWVAFLDDDDRLYPDHLRKLLACAAASDADLVWPWFDVAGGTDPFPSHFGRQWDPAEPHQFPITVLVRRQVLLEVGGFVITDDDRRQLPGWTGEDYLCWLRLSAAGAKLVHLPERTWQWTHHAANTSGLPSRW